MDKALIIAKVKEKTKWFLKKLIKPSIVIIVGAALFFGGKKIYEKKWIHKLAHIYQEATHSFMAKVDGLRKADEENKFLRLQNIKLQSEIHSMMYETRVNETKKIAQQTSDTLTKSTGSKVGRTPASIEYKPPANLVPSQLYVLAIKYIERDQLEKAATIMTSLVQSTDIKSFQTPRNYLLTGITWYKLNNFSLASEFFERAFNMIKNTPNQSENIELVKIMAQVRLWKALVTKRANLHGESQEKLRSFFENHPKSAEASWINSKKEEGDQVNEEKSKQTPHH